MTQELENDDFLFVLITTAVFLIADFLPIFVYSMTIDLINFHDILHREGDIQSYFILICKRRKTSNAISEDPTSNYALFGSYVSS